MSPLRSDNISGKIIFNFAFGAPPTLVRTKSFHLLSQTARLLESPTGAFIAAQPQGRSKRIFTEGVVTANGICCCRSCDRRAATPNGEARKMCNSDDRRLRRMQGGAVGAAACRMRVPPKARSRRRVPQPVGSSASKSPCLAALNTRHLLRKPVCGLKAPLGLSCPPGTAVLSGFLLGGKREHSPPSCIYTFYSTILLHNCFQFGFKSSDFLHKY